MNRSRYVIHLSRLGPDGMALFPFILVRRPNPTAILLNHERIHLRQQAELGILPFYVWYGLEYLIRRWQYSSHDGAYRNISFEREAYAHEADFAYLANRRWLAFGRYLRQS